MAGVASQLRKARNAEDAVFGANLMWPWIVANVVAFAVGGAIGGGVLRSMTEPWFGSHVAVMEAARIQATAGAMSSVIFWTLAGTAQWLVLRQAISAGWWMPVTVAGWTLSAALGGFSSGGSVSTIGPAEGPVPSPVSMLVLPPLIVLLSGTGQWLILRREVRDAAWWLVVNAGALAVAGFVGLAVAKALPFLAGTQYPSARALTVVGTVAGALYAVLTWQYLVELRRRA